MTHPHPRPLPRVIPDAFAEVARANPDAVAMQIKAGEGYHRLTYGEMLHQVGGLAAALREQGVKEGTRAAIVAENRPEWAIAYLGILAAGGTAVPLDAQSSPEALVSAVRESGSRLVFVSARTAPLLDTLGQDTRRVNLDDEGEAGDGRLSTWLARAPSSPPRCGAVTPDAVASLLYTSGTTKKPKGVLLTHANFMANATALIETGLAGRDDNFLVILPLHHAYPFMIAFLVPLLLGARMTFLSSLKGPDLIACLRDTRITMFVGVPQVFAMIRRAILDELGRRPPPLRQLARRLMALSGRIRDLTGWNVGRLMFAPVHRRFGGSLRLLCSGGAKLDRQVGRDLVSLGFTIREGYGLTETAPVVSFNPLHGPKLGSVGLPLSNVQVRIVDPDEQGSGEIAVRGPNVMQGYDRDPASTGEAIRDGWFHTGDLGCLDADGFLFVTGRLKELIVTAGGKNILPEELEAAYERSPAIAEVCVLPLAQAGGEEEHLHAVIVPDFDYLRQQKVQNVNTLLRDEIRKIALTLPPYMRIMGVTTFKDPLPRTRLGKIRRHLVHEQLQKVADQPPARAAPSPEDRSLLEEETGRKVVEALRTILPPKTELHPGDHLELDLGLDSLKRVEMIVALERQFGPLPEALAGDAGTVRELVERLRDIEQPRQPAESASQTWDDILKAAPPAAVQQRVLAEPRRFDRVAADLGFAVLRGIFRTGFKWDVRGEDRLPVEGPCLLASNHLSFLDPFLILAAVPRSLRLRLYSLGWQAYFESGFRAWIGRVGHVIPVGIDAPMTTALRTSAAVIRAGKCLLIFPEGQRSIDGRLMPFKKGIGVLASELGVPVVPIFISGSFEAWPPDAPRPRPHPISMRFGPAITITKDMTSAWAEAGRDPHEAAANLIREHVVALGKASSDNAATPPRPLDEKRSFLAGGEGSRRQWTPDRTAPRRLPDE